jgi:copper chaperone
MTVEKGAFKVVRLHSVMCKPIVENQLKNKNGVKKISIEYVNNNLVVEFDPSILIKDKI